MEITEIPKTELLKDLLESLDDINACSCALAMGITTYLDGTEQVKCRLLGNIEIVSRIANELIRRSEA